MINKVFTIAIAVIVLTVTAFYILITSFLYPNGHELDVTIENDTSSQISELFLTYRGLEEDYKIETIDGEGNYHTRISATENVDESSLTLYYFDDNNVKHEHTVIRYFERKGGGQASIVYIESIDDEGVLDITVEILRP